MIGLLSKLKVAAMTAFAAIALLLSVFLAGRSRGKQEQISENNEQILKNAGAANAEKTNVDRLSDGAVNSKLQDYVRK